MTRIGSFAAQNLTLAKNMETQTRLHHHQLQVSTGLKAQNYSGIAEETRRLEGLEAKHVRLSSFAKGADRTDQRLAEMENSLAQLQEVASTFRTRLQQAGSGDNIDKVQIQMEAESMLQQVSSLLNVDYEGRFLFSGSATDKAPVDFTGLDFNDGAPDIQGGAYYNGNDQVLSVQADSDLEVAYGITADPGQPNGFHKLISSLALIARDSDGTVDDPDIDAALGDLSNPTDGAIRQLADTRAQLGSSRAVLESTRQRLEDSRLLVEEGISDIENVDIARAMTELSGHQNTLEASYSVTARMSRLSLMNFLR